MAIAEKVPITMRTLTRRINHRLAKTEEVLKRSRGRVAQSQLGTYYVLHWRSNRIRQWHVDPVVLGTDLGALAAWETVAEKGAPRE